MNRGYVKLWRKIEDSAVFQNEGLLKVFVWCLIRANHKEQFVQVKTGRGFSEVKLLPGTFIFGRESAAKKLDMSPSTVWKRILKLEKLDFLNIRSNSHYSIIHIVNWIIYQATTANSDSESDRQVTGKEHRQECKNDKNKRIFLSDSIEIRLAELLLKNILSRLPGYKKPNIQSWARHIDFMIRIDKRDPSDISKVIEWSQQDKFWQSNILSTGKLRKQYDQLKAKMQSTGAINQDGKPETTESFKCTRCGAQVPPQDRTVAGCIFCESKEARA
ncbi:MAG: hypothetical protein CVU62_08105 [Deltaproteobacteria bacterium HGW-Deltaproteobacteria-2]|jgi:DNA-binding Lrp family transcriptional regulator|nr:MAG: hypothetical protein CVU62_08105 [Deltaproteobacteria bacterium HGW-Deltaproteobacteria-2]